VIEDVALENVSGMLIVIVASTSVVAMVLKSPLSLGNARLLPTSKLTVLAS
jgi:hypothetical protein